MTLPAQPAPPLIVDADIHPQLHPERLADFLGEPWRRRYLSGSYGPAPAGYWNPIGVYRPDAVLEDGTRIETDPRALAGHLLDRYGIDYGILNTATHLFAALSPEADFANAVLAAVNDVMIHDWLPADPRYRTALLVYPYDPDAAVREIHRLGDHPGVVQVLLPSASRSPYGQRAFHPIFAAAAEHGLPVAIHPGNEGSGVGNPPTGVGYPSNYLEWHTGLVSGYIHHLISLITEGVFQKFPNFKFVLIEGGVSWLPPILWRLDKNWKALRMTVPWLDRLPSEIVQEHILLTTQPIEEPADPRQLAAMLEMFDAGRMLMFATDFPHWDGDTPDFAARYLTPALRPRVMGLNAAELYRLPIPSEEASGGDAPGPGPG